MGPNLCIELMEPVDDQEELLQPPFPISSSLRLLFRMQGGPHDLGFFVSLSRNDDKEGKIQYYFHQISDPANIRMD